MEVVCTGAVALVLVVALVVELRRRYRYATAGRPWRWLRALLGLGDGVEVLARRLGVTRAVLEAFTPKYHQFTRPKRSGGVRTITAPDDETKRLQRRMLRRLLDGLKAHPAALGYRKGASIVTHAQRHAKQPVVVKLDVVDFFPSTSAKRIERWWRRIGWNRAAAKLLTRLVTHDGGLPQGAPTSPALSNLVNFYVDVQLTAYARRMGARLSGAKRPVEVRYSRYADDLTFSVSFEPRHRVRERSKLPRRFVEMARRILKVHGYRLHLTKKLVVRRRHQRQVVTGLVVNERPNLPRALRRKLRAARHHVKQGKPATFTPAQLQGYSALEQMIRAQRER